MADNLLVLKNRIHLLNKPSELSNMGFGVPSLVLTCIESLRIRPSGEKNYLYYLQEKLLESFSFPNGRWSRKLRNEISLSYRSEYLDILCGKFKNHTEIFGDDSRDSLEVYENEFDLDVDPNWLLYRRLEFVDANKFKYFDGLVEARINFELDFHKEIISKLTERKTISKNTVIDTYSKVSKRYGVDLYEGNGSRWEVALNAGIGLDTDFFLVWYDPLVLKRWGLLNVGVELNLNNNPKFVFEKSLNSFLPGTDYYFRTKSEINRVALAIMFQAAFVGGFKPA